MGNLVIWWGKWKTMSKISWVRIFLPTLSRSRHSLFIQYLRPLIVMIAKCLFCLKQTHLVLKVMLRRFRPFLHLGKFFPSSGSPDGVITLSINPEWNETSKELMIGIRNKNHPFVKVKTVKLIREYLNILVFSKHKMDVHPLEIVMYGSRISPLFQYFFCLCYWLGLLVMYVTYPH